MAYWFWKGSPHLYASTHACNFLKCLRDGIHVHVTCRKMPKDAERCRKSESENHARLCVGPKSETLDCFEQVPALTHSLTHSLASELVFGRAERGQNSPTLTASVESVEALNRGRGPSNLRRQESSSRSLVTMRQAPPGLPFAERTPASAPGSVHFILITPPPPPPLHFKAFSPCSASKTHFACRR